MKETERVYIVTDLARDADIYHTRENCHCTGRSNLQDIALGTAHNNGLEKCSMCTRFEGGIGPQYGLARKLAEEIDADDVLGGGRA